MITAAERATQAEYMDGLMEVYYAALAAERVAWFAWDGREGTQELSALRAAEKATDAALDDVYYASNAWAEMEQEDYERSQTD